MRIRSSALAARRMGQTFRDFSNGPQILAHLALHRPELRFRTRSGMVLTVPNVPGARFPVYESHADDIYALNELLRGLGPNPVVIDIGAHVGSFATAVCAKAPAARVHAFEASPSTAAWLQGNVDRNQLGEQISVHAMAVSDHEGTLEFVDNGQASAHNGLTAPDGSGALVEVSCIPFDRALELAGGAADVVKMDAEGAEYGLVLTSDPALWATVQRVVMEYHPVEGRTFADLVDYWKAVGLELVRQDPITEGLGSAWFSRQQPGPGSH